MNPYGWLIALGGFVGGVALESVVDFTLSQAVWLLTLALGLAILWRRNMVLAVLLLSVFILSSALGITRTHYFEQQFNGGLQAMVNQAVVLEGLVVADPDVRSSQQLVTVETAGERILVSTDRARAITYGDRVRITGDLEVPESFTTDLGRTFDYSSYLQAKRIEYRMSFAEVTVLDASSSSS